MKKFPAIVALVMALVMLVIPMGAMAEPTTATVFQIANPTISMDDESRTMPGLALQLALCESADASIMQLIADVIVNNQNANSAMLQFNSSMNVVGLLGGMSNAYTMNVEDASAMGAASGFSAFTQEFEQLFTALETWDLPNSIMSIIQTYVANLEITNMGVMTTPEGVDMEYISIKGDITDMIIDVMSTIENDPTVMAFIQSIDPYTTSLNLVEGSGIGNGNGFRVDAVIGSDATGTVNSCAVDLIVYSDNVDSGIIRITFDSNAANANFGLSFLEMDGASIMSASAEMTNTETGWVLNGSADVEGDVMTMSAIYDVTEALDTFALSVVVDEENQFIVSYNNEKTGETSGNISAALAVIEYGETSSVAFNASYALTDTGLTANGALVTSDPFAGESVISLNDLTIDSANGVLNFDFSTTDPYAGNTSIVLNGNYTETDEGVVITGKLYVTDSYGDSVALNLDELSYSATTGDFVLALSFARSFEDSYTSPISVALSLTSVEPAEGALYSGLLAISMFDGYSTIGATADVHMLTASVDTDNFYIDPVTAINVMTMTDEQMIAAESEFAAVMETLGNAIMSAYPSFFE